MKASSKRAEQHIAGALDRRVKRRIGFGDGRFDKNQPAERCDLRIGGQHPVAGNIFGFLHRVARTGSAGAADLRQLRHIGIAQHQADVGMRDEAAVGIDHISAAALADLDLRHHVPDQLEIDLGDAHPGIAPRAGKRQRHIGLGLAAEINRPVIDLVRHGLGEFRLGRIVDAAADHVHGEARDAQLLVARRVDLGELGDGRHLPQQPQRVEAALIESGVRPGQLRRPADLAVDLGDELLDFRSRALGLLALDADQRGLVLLVRKPDLENAVGKERENDHGNEQRHIFDEQAAAHDRSADRRPGLAETAGHAAHRPATLIGIRFHFIILAQFWDNNGGFIQGLRRRWQAAFAGWPGRAI